MACRAHDRGVLFRVVLSCPSEGYIKDNGHYKSDLQGQVHLMEILIRHNGVEVWRIKEEEYFFFLLHMVVGTLDTLRNFRKVPEEFGWNL